MDIHLVRMDTGSVYCSSLLMYMMKGAAIALLDTVFLSLQIPGIHVEMVGYGLPRVSGISQLDVKVVA